MKKEFIQLGNDRIKLSNIKGYGITDTGEYYKITVKRTKEQMEHLQRVLNEKYEKEMKRYQEQLQQYCLIEEKYEKLLAEAGRIKTSLLVLSGKIKWMKKPIEPERKFPKEEVTRKLKKKCLYVCTYQNDRFEYYSDMAGFNIKEKVKELDEFFER